MFNPHKSILNPRPLPLTPLPHPSSFTSHSSPLYIQSSPLGPYLSHLTPHPSSLTPQPSPLILHPFILTLHTQLSPSTSDPQLPTLNFHPQLPTLNFRPSTFTLNFRPSTFGPDVLVTAKYSTYNTIIWKEEKSLLQVIIQSGTNSVQLSYKQSGSQRIINWFTFSPPNKAVASKKRKGHPTLICACVLPFISVPVFNSHS